MGERANCCRTGCRCSRSSAGRRWGGFALVVLLAACLILISFFVDASFREWLVAFQGKGWKQTAGYQVAANVRRYGDWPEVLGVGGLGLLIAWRRKRKRWVHLLVVALISGALAGTLANVSKVTTGRTRPRESPKIQQAWHGLYKDGELLVGNNRYNSFPSGHTATAFGFVWVLVLGAPIWVGVLSFGIASWIAWSSLAIGAHHVSDVTVAIFLGLGVAWFCRWVAMRRGWEMQREC